MKTAIITWVCFVLLLSVTFVAQAQPDLRRYPAIPHTGEYGNMKQAWKKLNHSKEVGTVIGAAVGYCYRQGVIDARDGHISPYKENVTEDIQSCLRAFFYYMN